MAAQGYCPSHGCWQVVKAEHEQERPTWRAVGVQELAGLGIEAAQEGGEGTQGEVGTQVARAGSGCRLGQHLATYERAGFDLIGCRYFRVVHFLFGTHLCVHLRCLRSPATTLTTGRMQPIYLVVR